METIKELYKSGTGPSSSHTIGPELAAQLFKSRNKDAVKMVVELHGSLAATGKGHLTDWIIEKTFNPIETEFIWREDFVHEFHPNSLKFMAYDKDGKLMEEKMFFSVGGGAILSEDEVKDRLASAASVETNGDANGDSSDANSDDSSDVNNKNIYPLTTMDGIKKWCKENHKEFWEYVIEIEGEEIFSFVEEIWNTMKKTVKDGLTKTGVLPGELKYPRKAKDFYRKSKNDKTMDGFFGRIYSYALAVSEENSSGGKIVTAPTCGAAGVIPGLLYALVEKYKLDEIEIYKALLVAGLFGNIIKYNATISGAEGGCQAEIGSACAMASAMATFIMGGSLDQIEYAAEMGLEHHLGLTCDPVGGYVQIPCIERNTAAAARAYGGAKYAMYTDGKHRISFDQVVKTMKETGRDLRYEYRETSKGGLAKIYEENK